MKWSDRQVAMLREMGIRLWPDAGSDAGADSGAPAIDAMVMERESPADEAEPSVAPTTRPLPERVPVPVSVPVVGQSATVASSLDVLASAAASCVACRLARGRRQVVFGSGSAQAHWMIVGDAPGELEDESGDPVAGKAGQLLDNMLFACGLGRTASSPDKQVFITNALKCRPSGGSNPTADELAKCEPWLLQQIALVKPKVVLAMGRYAIQSLLHTTEPMGKLRGRAHAVHGAPDVKVVVTFQPGYLLRNAVDKARAWDDLCLAMEIARS